MSVFLEPIVICMTITTNFHHIIYEVLTCCFFSGSTISFSHCVKKISICNRRTCGEKKSVLYFVCVLRYEIEEGLKRLREVKPAGETYMHEGIKQVSLPSQIKLITTQ